MKLFVKYYEHYLAQAEKQIKRIYEFQEEHSSELRVRYGSGDGPQPILWEPDINWRVTYLYVEKGKVWANICLRSWEYDEEDYYCILENDEEVEALIESKLKEIEQHILEREAEIERRRSEEADAERAEFERLKKKFGE